MYTLFHYFSVYSLSIARLVGISYIYFDFDGNCNTGVFKNKNYKIKVRLYNI